MENPVPRDSQREPIPMVFDIRGDMTDEELEALVPGIVARLDALWKEAEHAGRVADFLEPRGGSL